jgi:hypothetical protein
MLGGIDGRDAAVVPLECSPDAVRSPSILSSGVMLQDVYSFAVGKRQRTSDSNCEREP